MESKIKKIGVLTSGGDAPGMNAAVRAVVRAALADGIEVFGIRRGYAGLMSGDIVKMDMRSVSDIITRGGTMLYSARSLEFNSPEGEMKAVETCKKFGLEGIVVVGGDGSFRGARALTLRGINCVGIPGTIDNDLACSDYTIGVDTALQTIVSNVDKVRDTSESHDRCTIVEVMGRRCGYLALHSGVATGAVAILVPEIEFDFQKDVIDRIKRSQSLGKKHFVIIAAEGIKYPGGSISAMAKLIEEQTGVETKANVMGHMQRGGSPTTKDRVVASQMGVHAVNLLANGIGSRVVVTKDDHIVDYDILEALAMPATFDKELYDMAYRISI